MNTYQKPQRVSSKARLFLHAFAQQAPALFPQEQMNQPEYYDDCTQLFFCPAKVMDVEQVMDIMEDELDFIILYHHIPRANTSDPQTICAYPLPASPKRMFKVNVQADTNGIVRSLSVMLFDSIEQLLAELSYDVRIHRREGHFRHLRPWDRVLLDFV